MVQQFREKVFQFLKNLKSHYMTQQFHSYVPHVHTKNLCPIVHNSIIHYNQEVENPTDESTDEWINRVWYIHTMGCYSAMKRSEELIYAIT